MQYIATTGWEDGTADLAKRLINELAAGKKVLWLLSGGSNITSSIRIMEKITEDLSEGLTIGLIDERFGAPGHADSNWQQLLEMGFACKNAYMMPVLVADLGLAETAKAYEAKLRQAHEQVEITIAQVGVGSDGHLAGILPESVAAAEKQAWVVGYKSSLYNRVTTTPVAFRHINAAYAFAFGEGKKEAVSHLKTQDLSINEQPAQILKKLPEAYLYSDQLGESV